MPLLSTPPFSCQLNKTLDFALVLSPCCNHLCSEDCINTIRSSSTQRWRPADKEPRLDYSSHFSWYSIFKWERGTLMNNELNIKYYFYLSCRLFSAKQNVFCHAQCFLPSWVSFVMQIVFCEAVSSVMHIVFCHAQYFCRRRGGRQKGICMPKKFCSKERLSKLPFSCKLFLPFRVFSARLFSALHIAFCLACFLRWEFIKDFNNKKTRFRPRKKVRFKKERKKTRSFLAKKKERKKTRS